jgi:hypothetical protein
LFPSITQTLSAVHIATPDPNPSPPPILASGVVSKSGKPKATPPIIGGVLGGALFLLVLAIWLVIRRRRHRVAGISREEEGASHFTTMSANPEISNDEGRYPAERAEPTLAVGFLASTTSMTGKRRLHGRDRPSGPSTIVYDSIRHQQLDHDAHRHEAAGAFESSPPPLAQIMGALEVLSAEVRELRQARRGSMISPPEYSSERGDNGQG